MSRRHRKLRRSAGAAGADSLDLLLGPMCNTFGGIVLTAVVLALLSREVDVNAQAGQLARTQAAADTAEMFQRRLAKADEDLARAQAFAQTLELRAQDPSLGDRVRLATERLHLREELQAARQALKSKESAASAGAGGDPATVDPGLAAQELRVVLAPIMREVTLQENVRTALDENLERLRQRQVSLASQLRSERDRSVKKWRLPKERPQNKEPYYVIVKYGLVYARAVFHDGDREPNDAAIESTQADGKTFAMPRPGRGLDPKIDGLAIESLFKAIPGDQFYVAFIVFQDSFGVFDSVKQKATQLDLDYGWDAFKDDQPLVFSTEGHAPAPPL